MMDDNTMITVRTQAWRQGPRIRSTIGTWHRSRWCNYRYSVGAAVEMMDTSIWSYCQLALMFTAGSVFGRHSRSIHGCHRPISHFDYTPASGSGVYAMSRCGKSGRSGSWIER